MRTASSIVTLVIAVLLVGLPARGDDEPNEDEPTTPTPADEPPTEVEVVDYLAATGADPVGGGDATATGPDRVPPEIHMIVRGSCPSEPVLGMLGDLPTTIGHCLATGEDTGLYGPHHLILSWRHEHTGVMTRLQIDSSSTQEEQLASCAFTAVEEMRLESPPRGACWVVLELRFEFDGD
jgi:hypothetical protein